MGLLTRTCDTEQMNAFRIFARFFVIVGAIFWAAMVWGARWAYQGAPFSEALSGALMYAGIIAVVFVIGLFYEYLAAAILAVGSVAVLGVGVVAGWETGVWATMFFFFVLPMIVAAVLYALAARMQRICEL